MREREQVILVTGSEPAVTDLIAFIFKSLRFDVRVTPTFEDLARLTHLKPKAIIIGSWVKFRDGFYKDEVVVANLLRSDPKAAHIARVCAPQSDGRVHDKGLFQYKMPVNFDVEDIILVGESLLQP